MEEKIIFADLFDLDEIQAIQDAFARASRVSSIITEPDGTPITRPSNFCRLCCDIIRKNPKSRRKCIRSDALLGKAARKNPSKPVIQPCLSAGLWIAAASINIGDRHIANWLTGQVRNETDTDEAILKYADEIGADKEKFQAALAEVPIMSESEFKDVCNALFLYANMLSKQAFQNLQTKNMMTHLHRMTAVMDNTSDLVAMTDLRGNLIYINAAGLKMVGREEEEPASLSIPDFHPPHVVKKIEEEYLPVVMKDSIWSGETSVQHSNGAEIPVSQVILMICNENGEPEAIGTIIRDISDRKQTEEALRAGEEKYKKLVENLKKEITERERAEEEIQRLNKELEERLREKEGKYLIFALAGEEYGISILKVKEIVQMMPVTKIPNTPDFIIGMLNLRGSLIPVTDLRRRFGLEPVDYTDRTCVIITELTREIGNSEKKHLRFGIVVDAVSEVLDIKGSDIEDPPTFGITLQTDYIFGMAKKKGEIKILLNMENLFKIDEIGVLT